MDQALIRVCSSLMTLKQDHFGYLRKFVFLISRRWMSEKIWTNWVLARWFGGGDVSNPRTFNEKLHWLRIHYRKEILRDLADKWAVRDYVCERIGEEYLNKVYAVWDRPEEVNLSDLPEKVVIKCSHGSGMNVLIKDTRQVDLKALRRQLAAWHAQDFSKRGREWLYTNRPRKITVERYLMKDNNDIPEDYKIFCFNGEPRIIQVDFDRFAVHTRAMYDVNWVRLPFEYLHPAPQSDVPKPERLSEMLHAAHALSRGLPFVRVDFYTLPAVIFGEMTFFPEAGTAPFHPAEWDLKIGEWLDLTRLSSY